MELLNAAKTEKNKDLLKYFSLARETSYVHLLTILLTSQMKLESLMATLYW